MELRREKMGVVDAPGRAVGSRKTAISHRPGPVWLIYEKSHSLSRIQGLTGWPIFNTLHQRSRPRVISHPTTGSHTILPPPHPRLSYHLAPITPPVPSWHHLAHPHPLSQGPGRYRGPAPSRDSGRAPGPRNRAGDPGRDLGQGSRSRTRAGTWGRVSDTGSRPGHRSSGPGQGPGPSAGPGWDPGPGQGPGAKKTKKYG